MAKKNNRGLVISIIIGTIVLIAIVVAVILGVNGNLGGINDAYFVSDGSKYVITIGPDDATDSGEGHTPTHVHLVYYYSGDEITSLKSYRKYDNEDDAKSAYDFFVANRKDDYKSITRDGEYLVLEANAADFANITADDIKRQVDFMEMVNNPDRYIDNIYDDNNYEDIDVEVETEAETEETIEE